MLKPQDLVVALKLWTGRDQSWSYPSLAGSLGMSVASVHASVKRVVAAGFLPAGGLSARPNPESLREFLIHGARYAYPARPGEMTRGVPTAHGAEPLRNLMARSGEPDPVWPDPEGKARGPRLDPLYPSVPRAVATDAALYEILALLDAVRAGRARERQLAIRLLQERLR